ncbi:hypothetical protein P0082_03015 [Candidatus Haliotispira prima]|uniref:Uncharacterized protein n=1 Tax=Candidatus Haliotispira prima TaxID=3034016 RepID=A0ABY8MIQ1_9SPIO|nr:hypothetical protein P0082_03015 [Candidatus Haliotispira prima]
MKNQNNILTNISQNSTISNIQYPISNIQYPISNIAHINSILFSKFSPFLLLFFHFFHSSVSVRLRRSEHKPFYSRLFYGQVHY